MSLRVLALALLCCAGLCLAAQPSLVTPADHKAQRLGLELETKHIYNDAKKSTSADTIYLVSLGAEDKLNGITQKHAWLTPADGRDSKSANPGPYTAAAIGAFTGEIDSYKGKGNDRCGLLEFVYRPMESITNADSVKRVMKVASLWEKSMIAPCVDPTLAPTARKREIICGGNTPSAPPSDDKGTLVYPAKVALDAFNAALGQELAAYTLKLESEAYHLVCPDMKFTGGVKKIKPEQPDDSELVKQIRATAVKHNQNIQDITKYSLDIYIHVNTYTAVSSLADGKYDLLFPEEADGARNTLKTCRETANEIAKTNKFPQYAPTLILACWAIAGDLEWRGLPQKVRDSAGGGGAKDIFVVMPKISVTALARAVLSEEESTAFFNYIKVTDLKNLAATFHEKLVTANILKVGDLGNFKTKFANILREVKTPFPQELESTQYGYGKVDTSDTAPYDDYGLATVNGVPVFVAELRKPDKHPVFGNVLPRKFNTNVDKVAGDMNTLLQELVAGPPKPEPEPEKKKNPKLGRAKSVPSLLPSQKK